MPEEAPQSSRGSGPQNNKMQQTIERGCFGDLKHTRNECRSEVVLGDLRAHHLEGKPHQIAAVKVGVLHCSVWFAGSDERAAFYRGLVDIVKDPRVLDEDGLLHSVGCFPFKSMREALEAEIRRGGESEGGLRRVRKAHAQVMKAYRE